MLKAPLKKPEDESSSRHEYFYFRHLLNSIIVEPKEKIAIVKDDPKDDIFIETAVAGNADFIVSQDKDLLKLKEFRGIMIITPEDFNKLCS